MHLSHIDWRRRHTRIRACVQFILSTSFILLNPLYNYNAHAKVQGAAPIEMRDSVLFSSPFPSATTGSSAGARADSQSATVSDSVPPQSPFILLESVGQTIPAAAYRTLGISHSMSCTSDRRCSLLALSSRFDPNGKELYNISFDLPSASSPSASNYLNKLSSSGRTSISVNITQLTELAATSEASYIHSWSIDAGGMYMCS